MKTAIIYLHGFNSASLDCQGNLLQSKEKLVVMQAFCQQNNIVFFSPNLDYRDFQSLVEEMLFEWNQFLDQGYQVLFMGSSMGGFASEYLAMKTGSKAIMINPAINPSELLTQFIGVTENDELGQPYEWHQLHCDQYLPFQQHLENNTQAIDRTILLDMADELIDSQQTVLKYQSKAKLLTFEGGSHSFEHIKQALPMIEQVIFAALD
ncbi:MAG: YqiA/YcfP family alpha/beta fold hydrolase [Methylomonas sp.]